MDSDDLFGDEVSNVVPSVFTPPSPSNSPMDYSDVEGLASRSVGASLPAPAIRTAEGYYLCNECKKVLKTRSGFTRHVMLHKLNDLNCRLPLQEDVESSALTLLVETFKDIEKEPAVGCLGVCKRSMVDTILARNSLQGLSDVLLPRILDIILQKTRVLPSAQLEESLSKFNHLLGQKVYRDQIKHELLQCMPEHDGSDTVLNRLVFRVSFVFMRKIQQQTYNFMRKKHEETYKEYRMSDNDLLAFQDHVGCILRSLYSVGIKSSNEVWQCRLEVLRERCIDSSINVNSDLFLNKTKWKSGEISVSYNIIQIFLGIEKVFQHLKGSSSCPSRDDVFNALTDLDNILILDNIREVTRGILPEDAAVALLQDLVGSFLAVSGRLEAKRNLLMSKQNVSVVSLRTDLKRNPGATQAKSKEGPSTSETTTIPPASKAIAAPKKSQTASRSKTASSNQAAESGRRQQATGSRARQGKANPEAAKTSEKTPAKRSKKSRK